MSTECLFLILFSPHNTGTIIIVGERVVVMNVSVGEKSSKYIGQSITITTHRANKYLLATHNPVRIELRLGQHIGVATYPCRNSTPLSRNIFNVSGMYSILPAKTRVYM